MTNYIDSEPIDWNEVYWRIQSYGLRDSRFDSENFGDCPISVATGCIEFFERKRQEDANTAARTEAEAWTLLFNSSWFEAKLDSKLLLPFPEFSRVQSRKISRRTARIIRESESRIPTRVLAVVRDVVRDDL